MKTKTFVLIIFACSLFKAQALVFPTSDAIWNIQRDEEKFYYGLSGDTIISGIVYNKLYLLNDTTLNIDLNDEYIGGFRQEGKKVWFRPSFPPFYPLYDDDLHRPSYPDETLLYDFSKNVGDTIWHNAIPTEGYYWTVKDSITASIITAIEVDEQERKIYHIEVCAHDNAQLFPMKTDSWIEGIGSVNYGLWWFLTPLPTCVCPEFHLVCFKQGDEVKYINKDYCTSCFCNPLEQSVLEKNITPFEVLHENNSIRIKGVPSIFPCELKLFSPMGQLIIEKTLQSDQEKILVNQLKDTYLYQVRKNGKIMKAGKIIIK